jgi:hypothetical protein
VPVPRQESERSCTCVSGISILSLSAILIFDLGIVLTVWFFFLYLIHYLISIWSYISLVLCCVENQDCAFVFRSNWGFFRSSIYDKTKVLTK